MVAANATGADYYVDAASRGGPSDDQGPGTSQRPWRTLRRAFHVTQTPRPGPGDTVWVREGTYAGGLYITRGGTQGRPLVIRAFPNERPVVDGRGELLVGLCVTADKATPNAADHVVIDGLEIRNLNPSARSYGINAVKCRGLSIRDCRVWGAKTGIIFWGCDDCEVVRCDIGPNRSGGVVGWSGNSNLLIADNHVHHNYDNICVRGPRDLQCAEGHIESLHVQPDGSARFSIKGRRSDLTQAMAAYGGLVGQDATGAVPYPSLVVLFASKKPGHHEREIPGGTVKIPSGQCGFELYNCPKWGGKSYSPDGKFGLISMGAAKEADLRRAAYAAVFFRFDPHTTMSRDLRILRNHVHHGRRQGILVTAWENAIIRDNVTHHNGATGIQIEGSCRNHWVEGNVCYNNSNETAPETGIWVHGAERVVVQDNDAYGNTRGIVVTNSRGVLVRRNVIYGNHGENADRDKKWGSANFTKYDLSRRLATGYAVGRTPHVAYDSVNSPVRVAFVHNTLYANGGRVRNALDGSAVRLGTKQYGEVADQTILNNLILGTVGPGADLQAWGGEHVTLDGNVYCRATGQVRVKWKDAGKTADQVQWYVISDPDGFADYRAHKGQDRHSHVASVTVLHLGDDADFGRVRAPADLAPRQPFARTASDGSGTRVPVTDLCCFSGDILAPSGARVMHGDVVMVDSRRVRIRSIDRDAGVLVIEPPVSWRKGAAVCYPYPRRDLRLAPGSFAIDRGQPLARATADGDGTAVPVDSTLAFSDGFCLSDDRRLAEGDEVTVRGRRARVTAIHESRRLLVLDRALSWRTGDPVSCPYQGTAPDVGAFEFGSTPTRPPRSPGDKLGPGR